MANQSLMQAVAPIQTKSTTITGNIAQTMSSREIAELTGKRHDHVMTDIRTMLESLNIQSTEFSGDYKDSKGRTYPCFNLPKRETLILVSGYSVAMRAKIIDRWQELEAQTSTPSTKRPRQTPLIAQVSSTFRNCMSMAKAMGLKGNQAIMSADHATKNLTGESPMALLGVTQLVATVQQKSFTPTQLGSELGISGQKVNKLLVELGLQEKTAAEWTCTTKGEQYSELVDTQKLHNGTPIKQLRWYESVLAVLKTHIAANA